MTGRHENLFGVKDYHLDMMDTLEIELLARRQLQDTLPGRHEHPTSWLDEHSGIGPQVVSTREPVLYGPGEIIGQHGDDFNEYKKQPPSEGSLTRRKRVLDWLVRTDTERLTESH